VYALENGTGRIFMFDQFGEPVFSFNQRMWDQNQLVVGTLGIPTSIRVNSQGVLYVTDRTYKGVVVFTPTDYANKIKNVNYLYNDGRYDEAEPFAREILRDNVFFDKANIVLGKNYFKNREWTESMLYFQRAKNTTEYSESFWEWRLTLVQQYFAYVVLVLLVGAFGYTVFNIIRRSIKKKNAGRAAS
jgi:hypothetical protein